MNEHDIAEQAYKNGYDKGYEDGKRDAVKHGRWIETTSPLGLFKKVRCNQCGCHKDFKQNYCPNCGARMDGDGNA